MQAQDEASIFLLKLWPRIEANKNRLIAGAVLIAIAISVGWIFAEQRQQKEIEAGRKLTELTLKSDTKPEAYLKIATDYSGTIVAERALLQGAAELFDSGHFPEAQAQFQKFLDEYPNSELDANATLGVAASLDAQNKTDLASAAYQRVVKNYTDATAVNTAKLALAKIYEAQGRNNDAMVNYQDVAQQSMSSSLRQEAGLRLVDLKNKMPAPTTAPKTVSPAPSAMPLPLSK
ncbi:MAG TPA: tetratricopeptide repeat protein [Verrucomicrobiae bacterium]|nr:tetratricopeptide repeat protein [Verrucomicrobiae bacterium]